MPETPDIDPSVPPSGAGCTECDATGGWWFHLRRCAACGHVGCCDSSPAQHASAREGDRASDHPQLRAGRGLVLGLPDAGPRGRSGTGSPPQHHPLDQTVPGPAGRVPDDWADRLH